MASDRIEIDASQIGSTNGRKRVRMTFSRDCFLDVKLTVPNRTEGDVTVLDQTETPPVLSIDDPFAIVGETRLENRKFMVESMFNTFDATLYSALPGPKFMAMKSWNRHVQFHTNSLIRLFLAEGRSTWGHSFAFTQVIKLFFLYWADKGDEQRFNELVDYLNSIDDI